MFGVRNWLPASSSLTCPSLTWVAMNRLGNMSSELRQVRGLSTALTLVNIAQQNELANSRRKIFFDNKVPINGLLLLTYSPLIDVRYVRIFPSTG